MYNMYYVYYNMYYVYYNMYIGSLPPCQFVLLVCFARQMHPNSQFDRTVLSMCGQAGAGEYDETGLFLCQTKPKMSVWDTKQTHSIPHHAWG